MYGKGRIAGKINAMMIGTTRFIHVAVPRCGGITEFDEVFRATDIGTQTVLSLSEMLKEVKRLGCRPNALSNPAPATSLTRIIEIGEDE